MSESRSPDRELLSREYELRFAKIAEYRRAVWRVLIDHYFQRLIPAGATLLDLGCGWGEFVNQITAASRYAMDMNPDAARHLDPEVEFLNQDCAADWPLEKDSLDVVFTSNFLEHLPDKAAVEATLKQAWRCLKPGGAIVCLGPNVRFVPGAYWDFWDHHVPISDRSLAELLRLTGFDVERQIPRFLPYSMSDKPPPPLLFVKAYLKLPLAWPLFGKQFLIVGRSG